MHTITGSESCSASLNASTCMSTASWLDSTYSCSQPQSRWDIESEWSFQMLIGAPIARLATRHHDRQPQSRGVVQRLGHVQQPLARGGRVGARACRRGADRDRHGGVLGLHVDELAGGELAGLDHRRERLDDVRLGRDRVGGDDLRAAQRHRAGDRARSLELLKHRTPQRPSLLRRTCSKQALRRGRRCRRRACPAKRVLIACTTDSSETTPVSAASPPSSAAFGRIWPMCSRQISPAGTVSRRSWRKPRVHSPARARRRCARS